MNPDEAAFLRTISETPGDVLPRLVYADWLDERGQDERAYLIRQPGLPWLDSRSTRRGLFDEILPRVKGIIPKRYAVRARDIGCTETLNLDANYPDYRGLFVDVGIHHGCVEVVGCRESFWAKYGPGLVRFQPITFVRFCAIDPISPHGGQVVLWSSGTTLPPWLFSLLPAGCGEDYPYGRRRRRFFHTRQDALNAVSQGAISWARRVAGLSSIADDEGAVPTLAH